MASDLYHEHPYSSLGFKSPFEFVSFLSDLGHVRATPSLRQDLSYTSIPIPLTPDKSLTLSLNNWCELRGPINGISACFV